MTAFLQYLPVEAFALTGDIEVEDRLIFTHAPPGTPPATTTGYGTVSYRVGWKDQSWDKVTVSFYLPAKGNAGPEVWSICVQMQAWGKLPSTVWRNMIVSAAPLGIVNFPA